MHKCANVPNTTNNPILLIYYSTKLIKKVIAANLAKSIIPTLGN